MTESLDQTDRDICAALLRNGRASWRLIAKATGLQERTISRRATRLFEQGVIRVTAFAHPVLSGRGDAYLMRLSCRPEHLVEVARALAHRPETLWVTTVMTRSAVIAECFFRHEDRARFVEHELPLLPIDDFSFASLHHYRRTVRGWQPGILDEDQLAVLGEDETTALSASEDLREVFDSTDRDIIDLLSEDGRKSIDAISAELGIAKPTVRKRIQAMQRMDQVSIRAVLDPAVLGFPHEVFVTARASIAKLDALAELLAADPRARWVAETATDGSVRSLLALRGRDDAAPLIASIARELDDPSLSVIVEPLATMYKRSDVVLPPAGPIG